MNERIRFPQVRVIDENDKQLGILETREAIGIARERGYDLILVAPQAQPPVCRVMDYGKYKYEQSKKVKKPKNAATELKMVRLHPRTGAHDRDILVRHSERFLREGHKVRVVCQFKGRENAYPQIGRDQLDAVAAALAEISTVEGPINKQGRDMTMMLAPKPGLKPLPKPVREAHVKGKPSEQMADEDETEDTAEDAEFEAMQARLADEAGEDALDDDESEDAGSEDANSQDTAPQNEAETP